MQHTCIAPHPWNPKEACGKVFYGRADAIYCPGGACRKRAHNAKPEVRRRKQLGSLKSSLARHRRNARHHAEQARELEGQIAVLEAIGNGQVDLVEVLEATA